MKSRIGALLIAASLALFFVASTVALAANATNGDDDETQREQARAAEAESAQPITLQADPAAATAVLTAPLFAGVNDVGVFAYAIDPATSAAFPLFDGLEVWGAAYNRDDQVVYIASGATLVAWPIGGAPVPLGTTYVGTTPSITVSYVGLAYYDGTLYGTRNIGSGAFPEAVYEIDTTTLQGTLAFTYSIGANAADIGGFDAHPGTGVLYGTNDDADLRGLVQLDPDGTITLVAPYPPGETDIDGLAVGDDNRAYLITDEPGDIFVFDFDTMTYTLPITNPWTTTELFAGGAWVEPLTPTIALTKTVGLDPEVCASEDEIAVAPGTEVTYCFEVENTGEVTLNLHDLEDSHLGTVLSEFPFVLEPEASVFLTQTAAITETTVNTATWTAFNLGPVDVVSATAVARVEILEPAITLTKTVGLDPNECAAASELTVGSGTDVTYCFEVTNTGPISLTKHNLTDSQLGQLLSEFDYDLGPSQSVFLTATAQITETTVNTATWLAYNLEPEVEAMATASATVTVETPEEPDIAVDPTSLSVSLLPDAVISSLLIISNTGTAPLNWTITEATPDCGSPAALPWVEVDPPAGATAAGGETTVSVTFDSTGLSAGTYSGALCVGSNDPDEPLTEVPLLLEVEEVPVYSLYLPAIKGSPDDLQRRR